MRARREFPRPSRAHRQVVRGEGADRQQPESGGGEAQARGAQRATWFLEQAEKRSELDSRKCASILPLPTTCPK